MANMHSFRKVNGGKLALPRSQQGIVLIISLMVLLIMLTAGIAIIRSSNVTQGVAGNVGFKKTATSVADAGVEAARAWLINQTPAQLRDANPSAAYDPTWGTDFDPLTYNWETSPKKEVTPDDGLGNHIWYVIHRMCKKAGSTNDPDQRWESRGCRQQSWQSCRVGGSG